MSRQRIKAVRHTASRMMGSLRFSLAGSSNLLLLAATVTAYEGLRALLKRGRKQIGDMIAPSEEAESEASAREAPASTSGRDDQPAVEPTPVFRVDPYDTRPRKGYDLLCFELCLVTHALLRLAAVITNPLLATFCDCIFAARDIQ